MRLIDEDILIQDIIKRCGYVPYIETKTGTKYINSIIAEQPTANHPKKHECENQKNDWIAVSERLPTLEECHKNNNRFIVSDTNKTYEALFDYLADGCINTFWCFCVSQPTYWMSLPEPPKEEKQ